MDIEQLKSRWLNLLKNHADSDHLNKSFDDLVNKYAEPARFYHRLEHIHACLKHFDAVMPDIEDPFCLELAIWLHDVIYKPQKKNNEKLSADYAHQRLNSMTIPAAQVAKVVQLINLSKHPSEPVTLDEKYLIDIDLSILGTSPDVYDGYEIQIRKEYAHIPNPIYKMGRKKLLKRFLNSEKIFKTTHFSTRYEQQAQANLQRALKQL